MRFVFVQTIEFKGRPWQAMARKSRKRCTNKKLICPAEAETRGEGVRHKESMLPVSLVLAFNVQRSGFNIDVSTCHMILET